MFSRKPLCLRPKKDNCFAIFKLEVARFVLIMRLSFLMQFPYFFRFNDALKDAVERLPSSGLNSANRRFATEHIPVEWRVARTIPLGFAA